MGFKKSINRVELTFILDSSNWREGEAGVIDKEKFLVFIEQIKKIWYSLTKL